MYFILINYIHFVLFYNEMEITWQGGGVPPHRVEMRTKRPRQRGWYPPYRAQMKRTHSPSPSRQNESNDTRRRGHALPHRVEMWNGKNTRRRGYAPPSLSRQKRNLNTTGRASALPIVSKWQERNEEGYIPPRRVKKETRTRRGGVLKWQERDEEGVPLLIASKRKQKYDGEGWCPPRHVEVVRTQWGRAFPSSSRQKENENTTGRLLCSSGKNALLVVSKGKWKHDGEGGYEYPPPHCEIATTRRGCRLLVALRERHRKGVLPSHVLRAC